MVEFISFTPPYLLRRAMNAGKPEDREKGEQKPEKPKDQSRKGKGNAEGRS